MARLLLVLVAGLPFLAVGAALGAWWTARSISSGSPGASDREVDFHQRMATLQHHTELLERARRASVDGEPGLSNIYSEAAERVLRLAEPGNGGESTAD